MRLSTILSQRIILNDYKSLGTSVIYSLMSPPSPFNGSIIENIATNSLISLVSYTITLPILRVMGGGGVIRP